MEIKNKRKLNDRRWAQLLKEIDRGNVVLVIGQELLSINVDGEQVLLKDYILREIANRLGVIYEEGMDFSNFSFDERKTAWERIDSDPYYETYKIINELKEKNIGTPETLLKLLSIDKFDKVITTTINDFVYEAMKKNRNVSVQQLEYRKNSNEQDISLEQNNFVYHMFGKVAPTEDYVLTDDDMLEFMHCWMDEGRRPMNLASTLFNKYLLVVGCNYPYWLFRFFFHSLKYSQTTGSASTLGMLADSKLDAKLVDFLSRMNAGVHEDAVNFVNELVERWNKYKDKDIPQKCTSLLERTYERCRKRSEQLHSRTGYLRTHNGYIILYWLPHNRLPYGNRPGNSGGNYGPDTIYAWSGTSACCFPGRPEVGRNGSKLLGYIRHGAGYSCHHTGYHGCDSGA